MRLIMAAVASLAGCGASGLSIGDSADMAVSVDLSTSEGADPSMSAGAELSISADLSMSAGGDLAVSGDPAVSADLAVGADLALPQMPQCMPAGGPIRAQYVWSNVLVPMDRAQYAFDLNGDGRVDNQLGNIEGAL